MDEGRPPEDAGHLLPSADTVKKDVAPELKAGLQGKSLGTEALDVLSAAAETERLQPATDVEMHAPMENGDSAAAHLDVAGDTIVEDVEQARRIQPASAADERGVKAIASTLVDAVMTDDHTDVQLQDEQPTSHAGKPQGQSIRQPEGEPMRGSSENDSDL